MKWKIINSYEELESEMTSQQFEGVLDVETRGLNPTDPDSRLLGFALSGIGIKSDAVYVPVWEWSEGKGQLIETANRGDDRFRKWILAGTFIGFNWLFDKRWIDSYFDCSSNWIADARIMHHLASAPEGSRPYNLEQLQKEVLGWEKSGKDEMKEHVIARAECKKSEWGAHIYRADLPILSKYACLDAHSTYLGYKKLCEFFNKYNYWPFLERTMKHSELMQWNTTNGIPLDKAYLEKSLKKITRAKELCNVKARDICNVEIQGLEEEWKDKRQAFFRTDRGRKWFLENPASWPKFTLSSDLHLAKLYYSCLGFEINARTPGGKPKVDKSYLQTMKHPVTEYILRYNHYEKMAGFIQGYLGAYNNSAIHPGFNICGTVSGRLGGFKPYVLNAPFKESLIMRAFKAKSGYVGIYADFAGIEPCVTAHYSEDPTLLKVYRDGQGDIYLDLALSLFPNNKELQVEYNPEKAPTEAIKKKFKKERDISKVVHLASQYGGTEATISRNLTLAGFPTSWEQARSIVRTYWRKFSAVSAFNYRLREVYKSEGYLENIEGRIIRVPNPEYKDLSNRFIQSSAHDILVSLALDIWRKSDEREMGLLPWIADLHDATIWMVPEEHYQEARELVEECIRDLNTRLNLCVQVRAEIRKIRTLAEIKND